MSVSEIYVKSISNFELLQFVSKTFPLSVRCFIADAPTIKARAFILNHRGHTSYQPCSKCKVSNVRQKRPSQRRSKSTIFDTVWSVPFEYMHLVCLGVMKKLLSSWLDGKYSYSSKLSSKDIPIISSRLMRLRKYYPSDFTRRPREIEIFSKFKATEIWQFLLYTGPLISFIKFA
ncbi:uncharacterized protein LOC143432439 [Xylocopa sonorina]|uniref:uncharacterized protein LOC143432439 n=1 Tax=Xylocopa sonorina TaxID=1818115 RepID=UPI00403AB2F3